MRQYIINHLQPRLEERKTALRAYMQGIYDNESLHFSSVAGTANNRANLRNCFIFGTVELEGDAKMADCVVMPGVTLHLGDGAIVTHSLFMPEHTGETIEVHVGKRSLIHKSLVSSKLSIGDDSAITDSVLGYQMVAPVPSVSFEISLGNNAFLYKTYLSSEGCNSEIVNAVYQGGSHNTILSTGVRVRANAVSSGDSFCIAHYLDALSICLNGFTAAMITDSVTPVQDYNTFAHDINRNLNTTIFNLPSTFGNNCYIGIAIMFDPHDKKSRVKSITAGNNVNIVEGDTPNNSRSSRPSRVTQFSVDVLQLGNDSTLAIPCAFDCVHRTFHELRVDDQSVLMLNPLVDKKQTAGYNLHITKQHAVCI